MKIGVIILAAGQGTRMYSSVPKVLHHLLGRAMIFYSLDNARVVCDTKPVVVLGHGAEEIRRTIGEIADFVIQEPQLGTAHAVLQAESLLRGKCDLILVTYADMPLLSAETLKSILELQRTHAGPLTFLTLISDEARGFGRVIRNNDERVQGIVEEAQATAEQLTITELNAGVYCFSADWLWQALPKVPLSPKGEYYLTDLVGIAVSDGASVKTHRLENNDEAIGINTRVHLAEAEAILRYQINLNWMLSGVTLIDPDRSYIEADVIIGRDSTIYPNTYLQGKTSIGEACVLGPNTIVRETTLGDRCKVVASVVDGAILEDNVDVGPFGHLRKGAHLAKGVHVGNFGEIKNAYLGPGTKVGHFSYIGDATIAEQVNIGAGTITCNFDGEKKNHTVIGAGVFIGSDTMLVAPVKLGDGARTGAGSVITKDVPEHTLAVGVPARAIRRLNNRE